MTRKKAWRRSLKSANQNSPDADRSKGAASAPQLGRVPKIPLAIALIAGAFFATAGFLVYATLLGMMPGKPPVFEFPQAILWLIGSIFVCAGTGIAVYQFLPKIAGFCGLIALLGFIATFNWIAFGPGERNFSKSTSIGSSNVTSVKKGKASEIEGRLAFGLVAGLFDALILYGIYANIRTRRTRKHPADPAEIRLADHKNKL